MAKATKAVIRTKFSAFVKTVSESLTPKERNAWRKAMAYLSSAVALLQAVEDPGVGAMGSEIQQVILENKARIIQAYDDAKA